MTDSSPPAHRSPSRLSRRKLLAGAGVGLAGTIAAGAAAIEGAAPATADSAPKARTFRFGTFNIHHGASPDDVLDLERVAAVIESMRVDVIGLQEVDRHWSERSDNVDQPAWLAERLGLHYAYGANLDEDPAEPGGPRRQYGTAILSRWPILSWRNTYLPKFEGHEQRGLLEATIQAYAAPHFATSGAPAMRLRFANTHLQHDNNLEREAQAAAIVDLLGEEPKRTVLVGDLNALPGTPEIATVTAVLDDVWEQVGEGPGYTYGSENPDRRIDYVLASPDALPVSAEVVLIDPPASDHLPVVAEYEVRPR